MTIPSPSAVNWAAVRAKVTGWLFQVLFIVKLPLELEMVAEITPVDLPLTAAVKRPDFAVVAEAYHW